MTDGTLTESYSFDAVGNRLSSHLSSTYTYEPFNRLKTSQTSSSVYGANGSMVTRSEASKLWTYLYDYENRLSRAADRRQNITYKYDALGRRVERNRQYGVERSKFTHDGQDVLVEETNGTVSKYQNGPGIDNKLSVKQGTTTNYFLADHLGSTNALTDGTGAITSQASYDSFGNQTGTLATRYGFTGRERDDATGLMYYRARFYDPKVGRFTSEDPIGFGGGDINLYGYVRNRPNMFRDPSGKSPALVPLMVVGGELGLHAWLFYRAFNLFPISCDPQGRKKHCYVNCMSTRLHGFNPVVPTIFSFGQEAQTLVPKYYLGGFEVEVAESAGDMAANWHGMSNSIFLTKSCYSICMGYSE